MDPPGGGVEGVGRGGVGAEGGKSNRENVKTTTSSSFAPPQCWRSSNTIHHCKLGQGSLAYL
jgi:hypothetical protein